MTDVVGDSTYSTDPRQAKLPQHLNRLPLISKRFRNDCGNVIKTVPQIRTELQVMFFDTDCGGVVHNIAYLRFVEIARTLLAEKLGLSLAQITETQRYPVVVRTEIDYRRPAKLGDQLVVEGWLDRLEQVRFWCAFQIIRPRDEAVIAECRQMLALVQMPTGKLLRLPDDWEKYRKVETT
jgi:YbgC/YbaW family acyl-CoA thioester hydrolase